MLVVDIDNLSPIFLNHPQKFDKITLQKIFEHLDLANSTKQEFELDTGGKDYQIKTSIIPSLQQFISNKIDRKNSLYFGFVAMEPDTGRVLSMVSYNRLKPESNICLRPTFPAASVFKIVTAAAAIETCGFNCNTPVSYNGNRYTLYKQQLRNKISKYSNRLTFKKAFAESVNPVFGNIGLHDLGKSTLESYASAFGFNKHFVFEIPLKPSRMIISDDPINWAEIACGFNNKTLMSPLHGVLLVSIIENDGTLIQPTIFDTISEENKVLCHQNPEIVSESIQPSTAHKLKKLLTQTVISGTASHSFRGARRDRVLSNLLIGGKTGSINNHINYNIKYDWFVGFAEEKSGTKKIALSVLVVHKDYIGHRASQYARWAIKNYFKHYDKTSQL